MKRLSEYIREAEEWIEDILNTKLIPPVKVVVVIENGLFSDCYTNDPFVEVSVHHLDDDDSKKEANYRREQLKRESLSCPYPGSVTEFGGPE